MNKKNVWMTISLALLLTGKSRAAALGIDWNKNQDLVQQSQESLKNQASVVPAAVAAPVSAKNDETVSYAGVILLDNEKRDICFDLSTKIIDSYEHDADMPQGVFTYQNIPFFQENKTQCSNSYLSRNDREIITCSGLLLSLPAASLGDASNGDVIEWQHISGKEENLRIVIGSFHLKRADSCHK